MRNHNILYIGIDENNDIKIGMTQQTPQARQSNGNYTIRCYADAGLNITNRKELFAYESVLRCVFSLRYRQTNTDRFERENENFYNLFLNTIQFLNETYNAGFGKPQAHISMKLFDWDEIDRVKEAIENFRTENIFEGTDIMDIFTALKKCGNP